MRSQGRPATNSVPGWTAAERDLIAPRSTANRHEVSSPPARIDASRQRTRMRCQREGPRSTCCDEQERRRASRAFFSLNRRLSSIPTPPIRYAPDLVYDVDVNLSPMVAPFAPQVESLGRNSTSRVDQRHGAGPALFVDEGRLAGAGWGPGGTETGESPNTEWGAAERSPDGRESVCLSRPQTSGSSSP